MLDWKDPLPLDAVVERGLALFNETLPRTLAFAVGAGICANLLGEALLGDHEAELAALVAAGDLAGLFDRFGGELLVAGFAFYLMGTAVLLMVGALGRGRPGDAASVLVGVLRRLPHLVIASLLFTLAVWAGLLLLILPGVFLLVALSFFAQAVLFDGHDGVRAIGASYRLTRGHWWRTLAFYALVIVANLVALVLLGLVVGLLGGLLSAFGVADGGLVELVVASAFGSLIGLATDAVLVAYYHDLTLRAGGPARPDATARPSDTLAV